MSKRGEELPQPEDTTFMIRVVNPCPKGSVFDPGGGMDPDEVELIIEETADSVRIVATAPVPQGVACNFPLFYIDVPVVLDNELGDRRLVGADSRF